MAMNRLELYKDAAGEWRWRVVAGNGEIVADSSEGYHNRADALDMARLLLDAHIEYDAPLE
jgi:uncharacterized protein YegP (UPF0339 family)